MCRVAYRSQFPFKALRCEGSRKEILYSAVERSGNLHERIHANWFVLAEFGKGVAADPCCITELNLVHVLVYEDLPEFVYWILMGGPFGLGVFNCLCIRLFV